MARFALAIQASASGPTRNSASTASCESRRRISTGCLEPALLGAGLRAGIQVLARRRHQRPPPRRGIASRAGPDGISTPGAVGDWISPRPRARSACHRAGVLVRQIRRDQGPTGLALLLPAEAVVPPEHALGEVHRQDLDGRLLQDARLLALAAAGAGVGMDDGMKIACFIVRSLCRNSSVIALFRIGQTLKQTSQRRPWKAMQDSWSMTTASPMRESSIFSSFGSSAPVGHALTHGMSDTSRTGCPAQ